MIAQLLAHGATNSACRQPIKWRVVYAGRQYLCCEKHLGQLAARLLGRYSGSLDLTPYNPPTSDDGGAVTG